MIIRPAGLLLQQQRLLTMRYRYGSHDRFNLPGGNLEAEETLPAGLEREFREELGIQVAVGDLLFCAETFAAGRHTIHLLFPVTLLQGRPALVPAATRASELVWIPLAQLAEAPLYPNLGPALAAALQGNPPGVRYLGQLQQEWFA
ncbi:MAG: NUDIX domain-containing protein [Magnetococcales bacterium]|nr:NUDIX domain-containing protein [Magnetococcales bacterium]MBF0114496.1 NUDIX domain-containing protein [Magnetococcales bacterium]